MLSCKILDFFILRKVWKGLKIPVALMFDRPLLYFFLQMDVYRNDTKMIILLHSEIRINEFELRKGYLYNLHFFAFCPNINASFHIYSSSASSPPQNVPSYVNHVSKVSISQQFFFPSIIYSHLECCPMSKRVSVMILPEIALLP